MCVCAQYFGNRVQSVCKFYFPLTRELVCFPVSALYVVVASPQPELLIFCSNWSPWVILSESRCVCRRFYCNLLSLPRRFRAWTPGVNVEGTQTHVYCESWRHRPRKQNRALFFFLFFFIQHLEANPASDSSHGCVVSIHPSVSSS